MNILIILSAKYLYLVVILLGILCVIFASPAARKKLFTLSVIAFPLSLIIGKLASFFIHNPRPFVVEHIKPLIAHAADNGFPSDHTLLTMTIAAVIFTYHNKWGIVLAILSLFVGFARVLAQIHHVVDIMGSVVIAIGATYIASLLIAKYLPKKFTTSKESI